MRRKCSYRTIIAHNDNANCTSSQREMCKNWSFCGLKSIVSETFWIYIICIASLANTCFHYIVRQTTYFRTSMFFCKITKNHQWTFFWGWPVQIEQVIRQCQCFMNIVLRGISKNWCFVWMKAVIKPVQYRRYCGLCRPKWHQLLGCPVDIL